MSDLGNKEIFAKNLQYYMKLNNKSRTDVCRDLEIPYSTFTDWCNANIYPRIDKIQLLANYFSIQKADLVEEKTNIKNKIDKIKYYMCPVYGRISAGQPNWAEECIEGRLPIDPELMNILNPEECFFLRVNGESMNKVIKNGAYALIRKTDVVDDGDIAVVLVNGYDATLKAFNRQGDFILLEPMSTDSSFKTQVYDKNTEIKVIGKYIGKMEMKQI